MTRQPTEPPGRERLLECRHRVLDVLSTGAPLREVLAALVRSAEAIVPGLLGSVLLLDRRTGRLHTGAAPSLPPDYNAAVDGLPIGPASGSCGTAAFRGETVVVADVATHPLWAAFRDEAARAGVRACWSEPIRGAGGEVLGTFAMYYREPRAPEAYELQIIREMAVVAGIAVERSSIWDELRRSEERFRQLAENISEVFWLTDWVENRVLYVSPGYEAIWGRSCRSLYDDPRSWSDPIHPDDRDRVYGAFRDGATEGAYDEEYRIVRDDGTVRWIHDRAFPIRDEAGHVYRVCGISEDVTARKQAELALARARAELDRRVEHQLESLTAEVLLAEERERRRVAEDLHDGLCQTLVLALRTLRGETAGREPPHAEIERLLDDSLRAARSLTYQLSPPVLHDLGFLPAIEWLVDDVHATHGLDITLRDEGAAEPSDERVRLLLYRAVRELLVNVARHAQATRARVTLVRDGEQLHITVADDGVAFDVEERGSRGLGLFTIRQRLTHLGGEMDIAAVPGHGTTITLRAPLSRRSAPRGARAPTGPVAAEAPAGTGPAADGGAAKDTESGSSIGTEGTASDAGA